MEKKWYVINTYSGHESKVKENLEMRVSSMGMEENIFRIIVPEQTEIEIKDGVKKEKIKRMFPGYVLIEMIMSDEAWFMIRNTPGVTGFIGSSGRGAKPFPLTNQEVDKILGNMGMTRLEIGTELKEGDMVRITKGPFADMFGAIKAIDFKNQILEIKIDLFGQETMVEIPLTDIEKA